MSPTEISRPWHSMDSETENQISQNRSRFSQCLRIHYISCTDKIAGFLVTVVGLLTSLWANCILVVTCTQDYDRYANKELFIEKTIIHTSQLSHFLIVVTGTIAFLYGIKVKNKAYFTPWIFIKIIELCVLLLGIIFIVTGGTRRYIGIIPFGLCFLLIGIYITLCVWNTYKNIDLNDTLHNLEEVLINSNNEVRDPPPSYESYTVQSLP